MGKFVCAGYWMSSIETWNLILFCNNLPTRLCTLTDTRPALASLLRRMLLPLIVLEIGGTINCCCCGCSLSTATVLLTVDLVALVDGDLGSRPGNSDSGELRLSG